MKKIFLLVVLAGLLFCSRLPFAQEYDGIDWKNATVQDIQPLLKSKDINKTDERGLTPLFYACHGANNSEIIKALTDSGADIHFKVGGKYNLLTVAAQWNPNPEIIQTLMKYGFDVNEKAPNGDTALLLAAMNNPNPDVIRTLIKAGADVNYKDKDLITPIIMAAGLNPNPDIVDVLVQNGADINAEARPSQRKKMFFTTALSAALVYNSNPNVTQRVLANGILLNRRTGDGESTLFMNVCPLVSDSQLMNEMIQKYGADIKAKTKRKGSTVLMVCGMFSQSPQVIQALIDNGAVVNERTSQSWTALMSAVANPDAEITKVLLKNGADVRAMEKTGNATALMIACRAGQNKETVLALIDGGSDIKAKDINGKSVYDWCSENPNFKTDIEILNRLK